MFSEVLYVVRTPLLSRRTSSTTRFGARPRLASEGF